MKFFNYIDIKYDQLTQQINTYLRRVFGKSNESFTNASPFGQIINIQKEFYQQSVIYKKNVIRNFIVNEATEPKAIRSLSRISGHNPTRSISATGTLVLKVKTSVNINEDISGGIIKIKNESKIKNKTNGLNYSIKLGQNEQIYQVGQNKDIYLNIVQGTYETYEFTGDGTVNQSFTVNAKAGTSIEHFDLQVTYNNIPLTIRESMMDMQRFEQACFIRTGMSGGIDIYFGNGSFGFIPQVGALITVKYLLSDGVNGIILTPQINDWDWEDDITDRDFNPIDIEDNFNVYVHKQIGFASNGETPQFTQSLLPFVSRNLVLASPNQYIYNLKRLSVFSKVNAYNTLNDKNYQDKNKVYLFLVPNIKNFFSNDVNYFNVSLDAFSLSEDDKEKTMNYLRMLANISIGTELEIIQPTITKYILNIYIRKFYGYSDDSIKQNIVTEVSDYLSNLDRDDRIPKSDIVSIIEDISGVDSVNVSFISKKNEDYHKIKPNDKEIHGLDPVLGDIIVESQELSIIRGGWTDRNFTYYNETTEGDGLGPINIMIVGVTDENINNKK